MTQQHPRDIVRRAVMHADHIPIRAYRDGRWTTIMLAEATPTEYAKVLTAWLDGYLYEQPDESAVSS